MHICYSYVPQEPCWDSSALLAHNGHCCRLAELLQGARGAGKTLRLVEGKGGLLSWHFACWSTGSALSADSGET